MSEPTPAFIKLLDEMKETYTSKNADYAGRLGTYFNFEYAAQVAAPFEGIDKVFATMLGIKLGRLAVLKDKEKLGEAPKNEPAIDSHKDLTTYAGIWQAYNLENNPEFVLLSQLPHDEQGRCGVECGTCGAIVYGDGIAGLDAAFEQHECVE